MFQSFLINGQATSKINLGNNQGLDFTCVSQILRVSFRERGVANFTVMHFLISRRKEKIYDVFPSF